MDLGIEELFCGFVILCKNTGGGIYSDAEGGGGPTETCSGRIPPNTV